MIAIRKAGERGHFDHGWLQTYHTFSFADYYDPDFMGFRSLRVINEDRVAPGRGFPTHGHRDMEIVTYVLEGALQHRDSLGNGSIIHPGEVQRMTAGSGVTHSESNPAAESLHLLQIWILPDQRGLRPGYEQKSFADAEKRGRLRLVVSPDGRDGSLTIHQDAKLYVTLLGPGEKVIHALPPERHAWVQLTKGKVRLGREELVARDGAAVSGESSIELTGIEPAELILFDLA